MTAIHGMSVSKERTEPITLHSGRSNRWMRPLRGVALASVVASVCSGVFAVAPAYAQPATVSLVAAPAPVAPGGVLAYVLTVVNNATTAKTITAVVSYDSNVTFSASFGADVTDTSGGLGTAFSFDNMDSGESRSIRLEVSVSSSAPITDLSTISPQLRTSTTVTVESGATTNASTGVSVRPAPEGGAAPFVVTMSDTPDPMAPDAGTTLAYRLTVINFGAIERRVDISLDYDSSLSFDSYDSSADACVYKQCLASSGFGNVFACLINPPAEGGCCTADSQCKSRCSNDPLTDCFVDGDCAGGGTCTEPGRCVFSLPANCTGDSSGGAGTAFEFLNVTPGEAQVLRLATTLNAGSLKTVLVSSVTASDGVYGGGVTRVVGTTVTVCADAAEGTPCDNGDVCPGDTCDAGHRCEAQPCPQVCVGAQEHVPCLSFDRCVVSECDGNGSCVPKPTTGPKTCTAGDPALIGGICAANGDCDSTPGSGDGVCEQAPQQVICESCETCSTTAGCEVDPTKTGNVCRDVASDCDVAEVCNGVNGACPIDAYAPDGTLCDDGNPATVASRCEARPAPYLDSACGSGLPSPCGNGVTDVVCTAGHPLLLGAPCSAASDCDTTPGAGDGICAPEQCDDGNIDSGDCCSPQCTYDPAGTSCEDGLVCNGEETCNGAGLCQGGSPPDCNASSGVCAFSNVCEEPVGCLYTPTPASGCLSPWVKAALRISEVHEGRESFKVRMTYASGLVQSDFGDPTSSTDYTVCLYRNDTGDFVGEIILDRGGDSCAGVPCWKSTDRGFVYNDVQRSADGIRQAKLFYTPDDMGMLVIRGSNNSRKGMLAQPLGITKRLEHAFDGALLQVRSSDGPACFEENLTRVIRTGPTYFGAKN